MEKLTSEQKVDAIERWQDDPENRTILCPENPDHEPMVGVAVRESDIIPDVEDDDVFIRCPTCGMTTCEIPKVVYAQYRKEVLGEPVVPIYQTPDGMYTDLKGSDATYRAVRQLMKPVEEMLIEEIERENMMTPGVDVEYYEYDCGRPCTPDGCMGHDTDMPVSISINGVRLVVEGADEGDFPSEDKAYNKAVKRVVEEIADYFQNKEEYIRRMWNEVPEQFKRELAQDLKETGSYEPTRRLGDEIPPENL